LDAVESRILEANLAEPVQGFSSVSLSVIRRVQHDGELSVAMVNDRQVDVAKPLQANHGSWSIRVILIEQADGDSAIDSLTTLNCKSECQERSLNHVILRLSQFVFRIAFTCRRREIGFESRSDKGNVMNPLNEISVFMLVDGSID
jgi:hypothetical protein